MVTQLIFLVHVDRKGQTSIMYEISEIYPKWRRFLYKITHVRTQPEIEEKSSIVSRVIASIILRFQFRFIASLQGVLFACFKIFGSKFNLLSNKTPKYFALLAKGMMVPFKQNQFHFSREYNSSLRSTAAAYISLKFFLTQTCRNSFLVDVSNENPTLRQRLDSGVGVYYPKYYFHPEPSCHLSSV